MGGGMTEYWGGTMHFFLLTLYNFKNIGGEHVPPCPPPLLRGNCTIWITFNKRHTDCLQQIEAGHCGMPLPCVFSLPYGKSLTRGTLECLCHMDYRVDLGFSRAGGDSYKGVGVTTHCLGACFLYFSYVLAQ